MTADEASAAPEAPSSPPAAPGPRRRGCLIGLLIAAILVVGLAATFYAKRVTLGLWLIRRGIPQQPWTAATQQRAFALLDRTEEAYRAGRVDPSDEEALRPLVDALEEATDDGEVSEDEAGPLLDEWEEWLGRP